MTQSRLIGSQRPRIWTQRIPGLPSYGDRAVQIGELANLGAFPWQADVLDVSLQYDPSSGRFVRRGTTLVVARQNGKTRVLALRVLVGLYGIDSDRLILHTAQDRAVPRNVFESLVAAIESSPSLSKRIAKGGIREANGQERITLRDGSTYRILAPRAAAFRTWSASTLLFDEAREQRDSSLWGAAIPTQRAQSNPQWFVASNAGDPDSVVLNRLRDEGRAAATDPDNAPNAYMEWSAADDRALDDPAGWVEANPSLGLLIDESDIRAELSTISEEAFRTEILCQWVDTAGRAVVQVDEWRSCSDTDLETVDDTARVLMAVDVDPEQTQADIVLGSWIGDRFAVSVAASFRNLDGISERQVARRVLELAREHRVRDVAYDPWTCGTIAAQLDGKRIQKHPITGSTFVAASLQLVDAVTNRTLWHTNDPDVEDQIRSAVRRPAADGGWRIGRAHSSRPIPAVMAIARVVHLGYRPERRSAVVS